MTNIKGNESSRLSYHNRKEYNNTLQKMRDRYRDTYSLDHEFNRAYGKFKYYKKNNKIDYFKNKYPDSWELLINSGRVKILRNYGSGSGSGSGSSTPISGSIASTAGGSGGALS